MEDKITYNKKICVSDFETNFTTDNKYEPVAFSFIHGFNIDYYGPNFSVNRLQNQVYYYDNHGKSVISDYIKFLHRYTLQINSDIIVYFHNGSGFDFTFLLRYLEKKILAGTWKQIFSTLKLKKNQFKVLIQNTKIINLEIKPGPYKIKFMDTFLIFRSSLNQLGEIVGLQKLDTNIFLTKKIFEMNQIEYTDFINYTKTDSKILNQFLLFFIQDVKIDITKYLTGPQLAYDTLKKNLTHKKEYLIFNSDELDKFKFFNQSYYGGYTYLNPAKKMQVLDNVSYYDINSSYPFIMTQPMPIKQIEKPEKNSLVMYEVEFLSFTLKKNYMPIIPAIKTRDYLNKTYLSELKTPFKRLVWKTEFEQYRKFYDNFTYNIINKYYFKSNPLFKEFVNKHYYERVKTKNKTDTYHKLKNYYLKIVLNACYGKLGENPEKPDIFFSAQNFDCNSNNLFYHLTKREFVILDKNQRIGKQYVPITLLKTTRELTGVYKLTYQVDKNFLIIKNVVIASYITAMARVRLFEVMSQLKDNFIYCDTDSVIFQGSKPPKINIGSNLGAWKIEHQQVYGLFIKPKTYMLSKTKQINKLNTKIAMAGINNFANLWLKTKTLYDVKNLISSKELFLHKNQLNKTAEGVKIINSEVLISE